MLRMRGISSSFMRYAFGCQIYIDNGTRTSYGLAWKLIMSTSRSDPTAEALRLLFPSIDAEEFGFTPIHKAILEMCSVSLNEVIGLSSKQTLDQPDRIGMTPLMWAASRGDLPALNRLLLSGADPNKITQFNSSALFYACQGGSYDFANLLLRRGADPNLYSELKYNSLNGFIESSSDDVIMLELLNTAKVNINNVAASGSSPLTQAIQVQKLKIATRLIHLGAHIHHREPDGTNGLYMATYFNSHEIIRLQLERGGDHIGAVQDPFESYLHLSAHAADHQTLKLLTNALTPRDIYFKRKDGMTALDVARERSDVDSNWRNAFNTFIGSVYQSTMVRAVESATTAGDIFIDALEQQP